MVGVHPIGWTLPNCMDAAPPNAWIRDATQQVKAMGEFYTPAGVSCVLTRVLNLPPGH